MFNCTLIDLQVFNGFVQVLCYYMKLLFLLKMCLTWLMLGADDIKHTYPQINRTI